MGSGRETKNPVNSQHQFNFVTRSFERLIEAIDQPKGGLQRLRRICTAFFRKSGQIQSHFVQQSSYRFTFKQSNLGEVECAIKISSQSFVEIRLAAVYAYISKGANGYKHPIVRGVGSCLAALAHERG